MQRICLLVLVLTFTGYTSAQERLTLVVRFTHPQLDRVNALVNTRHYKEAISLALSTADQMRARSNAEGYLTFMLRAAEIETFEVWKAKGFHNTDILPDYRRPQRYLETLEKQAGKALDDYPYLKANVLFTAGVVYDWLNMPDTAEYLQNHALELRKKIYGESSREVADSYLWRGVLYNWGLQRRDLAESNYRKAQELQKKFMPDSRLALGSVCFGLAVIAQANFQFDEALALANQYLSFYQELPYEQTFGMQLIANVYWSQGEYEKSIENRKEIIRLYKKSDFKEDLVMEYSNLAINLTNLGRYHEAEQALKEGERILKLSSVRDTHYARMLYFNYATLYPHLKKYDAAEAYLNKALTVALKQYGSNNDNVAEILGMRGRLYLEQGMFENALKDFQKMMAAIVPGVSPTAYETIPEMQQENPYFKNIIAVYFNKGDAFLAWYRAGKNFRHLEAALANYRAAYQQILIARQSINDELSKPYLFSTFQQSIENSIACAHTLFQKANHQKYIDDFLYFVELTKYLNVLDALQRAERASQSEIPSDLLLKLENARRQLKQLQQQEWQHEHLGLSTDSVAHLRSQIVELIDQRRKLIEAISGYTDGQLTDANAMATLGEIQNQLDQDEKIVESFWGRDSIYSLSITNQTATIWATHHHPTLDSLLGSIHSVLEGPRSYNAKHVEAYSRATHQLYQQIFQPVMDREKIIIIPDGPLNLIPVEALVVKHAPREGMSFKGLQYLIYDHDIQYAYSSSILFHKRTEGKTSIDNVLAFSYAGDGKAAFDRRDLQASLPGTFEEIKTLSRVFGHVTDFTGEEAVKGNFVKNASHYDLIHLGIHGVGNPDVVDNARLIFRGDSLESGDLYAYDIYNLKLEARLIVLSACETGQGKRQTGEGIFSIARAFSYAGCPSVVMSMWRAPDVFTATVMDGFYENLQDGNSISASLRQSKLQFLDEADELLAHPFNWATFVLNGQDQSFTKKTPAALWIILGAAGVALIYLTLKRTRVF